MGKIGKTLALMLIALSLMSITTFQPVTVKAQSRNIIVPDDYSDIQTAINHANDGDTIYIKSGTYQESNLILDKEISIIGEDRESTIIISQSNPYMFLVNQSKVTISGLTLIASSTKQPTVSTSQYQKEIVAIQIEQSQNCNICGNKIMNSGNGVWLNSSSNNLIEGNVIWDNYYGLDITGQSTHNFIRNNDISSSQVGIRFSDKNVNNNIISANNITSTYTGLFYYFSRLNFAVGNHIANNDDATHFVGSQNNVLHHNNFIDNLRDISNDSSYYDIRVVQSINFWDDKTEGNYWSNYRGTGNNGIGTSPYVLNEFNKDNYPLLESVNIDSYSSYSSTTLPYPPITVSPMPSTNPTLVNPTSLPTETRPTTLATEDKDSESINWSLSTSIAVVAVLALILIVVSVLLYVRHRKNR